MNRSSRSKRTLIVDCRWRGHHGIGRYAREVISRLTLPGIQHYVREDDPLSRAASLRACLRTRGVPSYSPGFNFFNSSYERSLLTVHDLIHLRWPVDHPGRIRLYYEIYVKRVCRRAPVVFTVSNTTRMALAEWAGIDPTKVVVTGCGVSAAFGHDGPKWSPSWPYLLCVGNAKPHKNLPRLLEAFAAARLPKDCRLVLVGPPNLENLLMEGGRVKGNLCDRLVFKTGVDDIELAMMYRGARAVVVPSLEEGYGLPLLEATACGTQVVASDIPVFREVGHDDVQYFDPTSLPALIGALESMWMVEPEAIGGDPPAWQEVAAIVDHGLRLALTSS